MNKIKKDKNDNYVMLSAGVAWNSQVKNKVKLGQSQYVVKYTQDGQRKDEVFESKVNALNFFESIK